LKAPKAYFYDVGDVIGDDVCYANRLQSKRVTQIVANLERCYDNNGIRVVDPLRYFTHPPWES